MNTTKTFKVAAATALLTAGLSIASAARAETYHWFRAVPEREGTSQAIKALIAKYKETHPDFDIQIEWATDRPSYLQKLKILATSDELPDLFDSDAEPYFAQLAANGMVANIGNIFDELKITDKFFPLALDYERLDDGSLFLIPWQSNTEYFWYHPSAFEKVGVEVPKTLDDFKKACETLAKSSKVSISIDGKDYWPVFRYLSLPAFRETGNQFLTDLKNGKASMTDPVGVESAKFLQDVGKNCFQQGWTTADYTTALNLFLSGDAAIHYVGTWELPSMLDEKGNLKNDIKYFKMPVIDGKMATKPMDFYAHAGIGTAIKAGSDTDEMKDFLKFFAENFGDMMMYDYHVLPSLKPTIKPELPQIYKDILDDVSKVGTYTHVWDVKLDPNTVDVLYRQSQLLVLGQTSPEQFGKEIDEAVKQYNAGK